MSKHTPHVAPFPSKEQILEVIKDSPGRVGKPQNAPAFHLEADQKVQPKKVVKEANSE